MPRSCLLYTSTAWLHHKGRNRHHLEYWIDYDPAGSGKLIGNKMPLQFVAEMFCDRVAASKVYKGKDYTDASPWEYYDRGRDHYVLHPETRQLLEYMLITLRDKGEDEAFRVLKKEVLGR